MTFPEAITQLMSRPDFIAVLEPDMILSIGRTGTLIDERKGYTAYPRLTARHCMAITWQVFTREQHLARIAEMERDLAARGVISDHQ